jgi:hypothetical protein
VFNEMGADLRGLGLFEDAEAMINAGVALQKRVASKTKSEASRLKAFRQLANYLSNKANLYLARGPLREAEQAAREALKAAEDLEKDGISVEVIDPRSLVPFDWDLVKESVGKTGRVITVEESPGRGGLGAEIAADDDARRPDVEHRGAPERQAAAGHHRAGDGVAAVEVGIVGHQQDGVAVRRVPRVHGRGSLPPSRRAQAIRG